MSMLKILLKNGTSSIKKFIMSHKNAKVYLIIPDLLNRGLKYTRRLSDMFILDRMTTSRLMEKALNTESLRRNVIGNNIANVDVPHFKRSEVNFESELRRVINENESQDNLLPARTTDPRHIPFHTQRDMFSVMPRLNLDYNTTMRNDGNNVDIEKEVVDSSKNMMRYNAFSQIIAGGFSKIKNAMRIV
jgi:flagellar basal-body rod protein FlgB